MKVLLLNLPWSCRKMHGVRAGSRWPHLKHKPEDRYLPFPFFLAYAASLLKKNGLQARLLDAIAEGWDNKRTVAFIQEYNPTHLVVETSVITLDNDLAFLEQLNNEIEIILAGPNAHIWKKDFLANNPRIDYVIKGEYELALLELLTTPKRPPRGIITPSTLCDLNLLPWPERDDVPLLKYHDTPGGIPEPSAQMMASRGCPFGCIFCLWPAVMYGGNNYRVRDYRNVIDEMEMLAQRGFKSVYFDDDTFGLDRAWVITFAHELIARRQQGRVTIPWAMMTRADRMDRDMLIMMKKAGLSAVKYGVESSSPDILAAAHKKQDLALLERIITYTKSLEIKVHLTFTFGLPHETPDTIRDTLLYSFHLDPDSAQFSLATPFPGTPYYEYVKKNGQLITDDLAQYDGNYHAVVKTAALAPRDLMRYKNKAYHLWNIFDRAKKMGRFFARLGKIYIYARLLGFNGMLKKIVLYIRIKVQFKKRIRDRLRYLGFFHGSKAFVGPSIVQIDLTNDCNNDCIACWCNSPLLEDKKLGAEQKKIHLSLPVVQRLIDDLVELGTKEVFLSGGGEPFMHPQIMEIIHLIKHKGLTLHINTNFTLVTEEIVQALVDLKVDFLTVSLWAGTPDVYARTHPNKDGQTFDRIVSLLKYLQRLRTLQGVPHVKLYHVISSINYGDLENMYAIAVATESDVVEFALLDPIPGKTDILLLNDAQLSELRSAAEKLRQTICAAEKDLIPLPKIVQLDQFLRRIADKSSLSGNYDQGIIDSFPCYAGWVFSRIVPDGNVNACLKAHRIPIGNINQESFKILWNSAQQLQFRKETSVCKKTSTFFSHIGNDPSAQVGCHKGCDDLGRNLLFHEAIGSLNVIERLVLKTSAKIIRVFNPQR